MNTKPNPTPGYKTTEFWLTLGLSLIAAAMAFLETIDTTWAVIAVTILNSIYTLARMGTKAAVERAKSAVPVLLACGIIASALPSCEAMKDVNFSGPSFYYVDEESGAKGGIIIEDGKTKVWGRYPITDPDTGEITGWFNAELPPMDLIKRRPASKIISVPTDRADGEVS